MFYVPHAIDSALTYMCCVLAVCPTHVQELRDVLKELERVLALHYSDDEEVIRRCCYTPDGEAPTVSKRWDG